MLNKFNSAINTKSIAWMRDGLNAGWFECGMVWMRYDLNADWLECNMRTSLKKVETWVRGFMECSPVTPRFVCNQYMYIMIKFSYQSSICCAAVWHGHSIWQPRLLTTSSWTTPVELGWTHRNAIIRPSLHGIYEWLWWLNQLDRVNNLSRNETQREGFWALPSSESVSNLRFGRLLSLADDNGEVFERGVQHEVLVARMDRIG